MDAASDRSGLPSIRTLLLVDALFEFAVAAALLGFAGTLGDWLGVGTPICVVGGVIFAAAGVALAAMWRSYDPDPAAVQALAFANIAGGVAGWLAFAIAWSFFEPGGRAVLGTASDVFIALGVVELLALRDQRRTTDAAPGAAA